MIRNLFFTLLGVLCFVNSSTGQRQVSEQLNSWYMYFGDHRISKRFGIHTDYQYRRHGYIGNWQQSLARVGLNIHTNNNIDFSVGYTNIITWPYGDQPVAYKTMEHQIYDDLVLKHQNGRFNFNHRYRFEQRFIENKKFNAAGDLESDGYLYRNRARYRLMVTIPLNSKELEDGSIYMTVFDEVWINFGTGSYNDYLNQNWMYGALGYRFSKAMKVDIGYLNQYLLKPDGILAERNHTLQVAFHYSFDFRSE